MSISLFQQRKINQQKISMMTCYDYTMASIIAKSDIDCILVGDSAAMVMHGFNSTVPATTPMIATHVSAVAKGASNKFIISDMPFCSYRSGIENAVHHAQQLMQAGASAIKLEGSTGNLAIISHLVHSGIPVMGHLGLTPQSVNTLGGFKVQGKQAAQAEMIRQQAEALATAGCFSLVLECVPSVLAKTITEELTIPTIGIGAGPHTDGQVLVLQDMLGLNPGFKPKFLKQYADGFNLIKNALNTYHADVSKVAFPCEQEHSY